MSTIVSVSGPVVDRMEPIVVRLHMTGSNPVPWIGIATEFDKRIIFDPTEVIEGLIDKRWSPMYRDRSSIVQDGIHQLVSILPSGGWWREGFDLFFIDGTEIINV